jgi:cytochrome c oxidase cbb3-type subunit 3
MNENGRKPTEPVLLEHDADGIHELDNLLPRWWVWLFYLTIAFSAVYMVYYHVLRVGDLQAAAYQKEFERGQQIKSQAITRFEATVDSLQPMTDPAALQRGQGVYTQMCAPCHRPDGGGQVGPNLCDDYWIHGSNYVDTLKVIINGVPEKGMLSWRELLNPREVQAVASHIYTLRGTSPPNPKPREDQQQPEQPNIYE